MGYPQQLYVTLIWKSQIKKKKIEWTLQKRKRNKSFDMTSIIASQCKALSSVSKTSQALVICPLTHPLLPLHLTATTRDGLE